jgi:hypothetical protein
MFNNKRGIVVNITEFLTGKKKEANAKRLDFFKAEREMVRIAMEEQAASKSIGGEAKEILTAEEIAALFQDMSSSGYVYRVTLDGAAQAYRSINLANYRREVDALGHLEREQEFLRAMCLIDKCDEFADYESMSKAFRIFEYVVRHNKTNAPVIAFARQFIIQVRRYLEELNVL